MREIKFRAWDVANNQIYDVKMLQWEQHSDKLASHADEPIMQYTGLQDKNGKEIYEGDIYQWKGYEVSMSKQTRPVRTGIVEWNFKTLFQIENIIAGNGSLEVIGNIYENPELIG